MGKSIKLKNDIFFNGEICDMGSNANGTYIKWANGLMVCFNTQTFTNVQCTTQWGNTYCNSGDRRLFNHFPKSFKEKPTILKSLNGGSGNGWLITDTYNGAGSVDNAGGWFVARATSLSNMEVIASYVAIGKWK